jgi:hypothetical protein
MKGFILLSLCFILLFVICYFWVTRIDKMKNDHPNYKGEELFGDDETDKNIKL